MVRLVVITLEAVMEVQPGEGFEFEGFWPVAELAPYGFLALHGGLGEAEVGTAVMSIAACNEGLQGLLTAEELIVSGGLRMTDTGSGVTVVPGCCNGLEQRGEWLDVLAADGEAAGFGHDPAPVAERVGDFVRVSVDAGRERSPVIEVSVGEMRRLLGEVERDLGDFLRLAEAWAGRWLPEQSASVTAALARALVIPPFSAGLP